MKRTYVVGIAALCVVAITFFFLPSSRAQKAGKFKAAERPIPNRYIVVLQEDNPVKKDMDVDAAINSLTTEYVGTVDKVYRSAIKGYSVTMTREEAERLSSDPRVKYVEEDAEISPQTTQTGATWGIARIDQRAYAYPLDQDYSYTTTGNGVSVYVIDTGININHPDFNGRAFNAVNTSRDNTPIEECNGHGTHVAGTIGSTTYGVAKNVNLYSVRVFPCWGGTAVSNVVAGVDWVSRHSVAPAVANMSLGGAYSDALEQAVRNSISQGITYVVAAGNSNRNACEESPAHVPEAITVGMTDQRDYRADISNYGVCVDIFAPGAAIASTGNMPNYPYEHIMSGTSTASPHVAGVAALYLEANPGTSPQQVRDAIVGSATPDILTNIGEGSPNLFLYSVISDTGGACPGTIFGGTLPGSGNIDYQSSSLGFLGASGRYSGSLRIPDGAIFNLILEKKSKSRWATVAASSGSSTEQTIRYNGRNGTYRWRIASVSGSGGYSLCAENP
jgi:aqualysin 1